MAGLITEGKELFSLDAPPEVLDAALISRHSGWSIMRLPVMVARSLAEQLGMRDIASDLQATLNEEKKANEKLNELAPGHVNQEAMASAG